MKSTDEPLGQDEPGSPGERRARHSSNTSPPRLRIPPVWVSVKLNRRVTLTPAEPSRQPASYDRNKNYAIRSVAQHRGQVVGLWTVRLKRRRYACACT